MDRAHRLGQTRQVTVYRLITKGTIDERIIQLARVKKDVSDPTSFISMPVTYVVFRSKILLLAIKTSRTLRNQARSCNFSSTMNNSLGLTMIMYQACRPRRQASGLLVRTIPTARRFETCGMRKVTISSGTPSAEQRRRRGMTVRLSLHRLAEGNARQEHLVHRDLANLEVSSQPKRKQKLAMM